MGSLSQRRRSSTARAATPSQCWKSSLTQAGLRLHKRGERGDELAPRSPRVDFRSAAQMSSDAGHDPGSLFEIVQTESRISFPGLVQRLREQESVPCANDGRVRSRKQADVGREHCLLPAVTAIAGLALSGQPPKLRFSASIAFLRSIAGRSHGGSSGCRCAGASTGARRLRGASESERLHLTPTDRGGQHEQRWRGHRYRDGDRGGGDR